jgi:hypothetical protein
MWTTGTRLDLLKSIKRVNVMVYACNPMIYKKEKKKGLQVLPIGTEQKSWILLIWWDVKIQNNIQLNASNTAYWRVWDAALRIIRLTGSCGSLWLSSIREKIYAMSTAQEKILIQNSKYGFYWICILLVPF